MSAGIYQHNWENKVRETAYTEMITKLLKKKI